MLCRLSQCKSSTSAGVVNRVVRNSRHTRSTRSSHFRSSKVVGDKRSMNGLLLFGAGALLGLYQMFTQYNADDVFVQEGDDDEQKEEKIEDNPLKIHSEMTFGEEKVSYPIYRIVITGGPCGGKTTALASISERLQSYGFTVFRVPEAATLIIQGTMIFPPNIQDHTERLSFEASLVKTKMALEDIFYGIAQSHHKPCVILCDRGTMDSAAYLDKDDWEILLDEENWNVVTIRDRRYDAIIHMVTAAIGAENFYTVENNSARTESLNQARDLDFKVLNAWVGHPHIKIIDNSTNFQKKVIRVEEAICQIVGAPRPTAQTRKFILDDEISRELVTKFQKLKCETFELEQTYLGGEGIGYNYLRKRGQNGMYTYTHSVYKKLSKESEEFVILERSISGREYVELLKQGDKNRIPIIKRQQCFLWNNMYYEISTFLQPDIKLTVLNLQTENPELPIEFPWFIKVKGEVSGLEEFSSHMIASNFSIALQNPQIPLNWKQNQQMVDAYTTKKNHEKEIRSLREEMMVTNLINNKN